MKKSLFISLSLACGLSFVYTACDEYDDTYPQEYHKILSLKQTGEEDIILYSTGEDASFNLTVMKSGCDPSLTAQAQLKVMSPEELQAYNNSYTALPSTTYSIEGSEINFTSQERYKIAHITMKTEIIGELMEREENKEKTFVLPITLVSETDSVNSMNNMYIARPVITTPKVSFQITEEECVKSFTDGNTPVTFTIPLGMAVDNLWNFTAKVEVVDNTGKAGYIDPKFVTLENDGIVIFEANKEASLKVTIAPGEEGKLTNLVKGGKVEIKITAIEGIEFDFEKSPFTLTITGKEYDKMLDGSMLSYNFTAFASGTNADLFDKNPATYVQTPWPNKKFSDTTTNPYLQLSLPEGVTDFAVSLTQQPTEGISEAALLRGFDIIGYTDEACTEEVTRKSYSPNDLTAVGFINGGASFTTDALHSDTPIKYIRIVQTWNCEGTQNVGVNDRWHFRLAEINLYGATLQ